MRTVRVLLILAAAMLIARPLFAQEEHKARGERRGGGPGDIIMRILSEKVASELKLTDEQKTKLKAVREKYGRDSVLTDEQKKARTEAIEAAKKDGKTGFELMRAGFSAVKLTDEQKAKIGENAKTSLEEVKKILNSEQQEKLKSLVKERRERKPADASK